MSLLMDALKRAEKARGAPAGDEADESPGVSETQGLSLDPLEFAPPREFDDDLDLTGEQEHRPPADSLLDDLPDSLTANPLPDDEPFSLEPRPDYDDTGIYESPQTQSPGLDDGAAGGNGDSAPRMALMGEDENLHDDTSATLPSVKSAQESVDSYFDGTRSISISLGAVRTAVDDDTLTGEREVYDTGRQRSAANSILQANRARKSSTNWTVLAALPLLMLAVVAGAGYVYWNTLIDIFGSGTSIASRSPTPAAPALAVTPGSGPAVPAAPIAPTTAPATAADTAGAMASQQGDQLAGAAQGSVLPSTTGAPATGTPDSASSAGSLTVTQAAGSPLVASGETGPATAPIPAQADAAAAAASGTFTAAPIPQAAATPVTQPSVAQVAGPIPSTAEAILGTPDPEVVQRLAAAVAAPQPGGLGGAIRITRKSVPARVHPMINRGYAALKDGNLERAQRAYREVLRAQPRSRDAILGLAAVSMQAQDWNGAQGLYLRLLSVNPRDTLAQAAVLSLQENVDPVQSEATIKSLLRREPDDSFLHFSLGNMFSEQGRWAEAQQAYFDAHRLDTTNADYAFNLAVALEQLTQPNSALDFYRRALELADDGYASFQTEMVLARIQTLSVGSPQ